MHQHTGLAWLVCLFQLASICRVSGLGAAVNSAVTQPVRQQLRLGQQVGAASAVPLQMPHRGFAEASSLLSQAQRSSAERLAPQADTTSAVGGSDNAAPEVLLLTDKFRQPSIWPAQLLALVDDEATGAAGRAPQGLADSSDAQIGNVRASQQALSVQPEPPVWPDQFHAVLFQNRSGQLALVDLWYDWPGGRNFNIIRKQLANTIHDLEWTNHTSFYWDADAKTCKETDMGYGILRRGWLKGADYLGQRSVDGFDCDVWTKADGFVTYYADVKSGRPVYWEFGNGTPFTMHVLHYQEGGTLPDGEWQTPDYCFR